jgi:hypothetical protein
VSAARNGDGGSVTAEFAIVVPAVIAVFALVLGGIALGRDALAYATAAHQGARAVARGHDPERVRQNITGHVPGAVVEIVDDLGEVCVTVRAAPAAGARAWFELPAARECVTRDI